MRCALHHVEVKPKERSHPSSAFALYWISEHVVVEQRFIWKRCDATPSCHESCVLVPANCWDFYFHHPYMR